MRQSLVYFGVGEDSDPRCAGAAGRRDHRRPRWDASSRPSTLIYLRQICRRLQQSRFRRVGRLDEHADGDVRRRRDAHQPAGVIAGGHLGLATTPSISWSYAFGGCRALRPRALEPGRALLIRRNQLSLASGPTLLSNKYRGGRLIASHRRRDALLEGPAHESRVLVARRCVGAGGRIAEEATTAARTM